MTRIKNSIGDSVARASGSSNIKTGTGQLSRHAEHNFDVSVRLIAQNELEIEAVWRPANFPYFLIQLWGGLTPPHDIRPRNKAALWWSTIRGGRPVGGVSHPGARIPAHDFIRLDRQVEREINSLLRRLNAARKPPGGAVAPTGLQLADAKRLVKIAAAIVRDFQAWMMTHRLTLHSARRLLRRNGLSEGAARTIAPVFMRFKRRKTMPVQEVASLIIGLV